VRPTGRRGELYRGSWDHEKARRALATERWPGGSLLHSVQHRPSRRPCALLAAHLGVPTYTAQRLVRADMACKGLDTPILWRSLYISRSWEGAVLGLGSSTLSSCRLNAALVFGGPAAPSVLHGGAGSMPRVDCRRSLRVPRAEACTPADGRLSPRGEGRPEETSAIASPRLPQRPLTALKVARSPRGVLEV
jgi:hypothetical protein